MVSKHHLKDALYILFLIFPSTLCFVNMNIDTVEPENGEKVILSASTNQTAVTWFFKGSQISYCLISTTSCIPAGADNMNFTVIATTSYVTISPYNCTKNDGVYLVTTLTDSDTLTLKSSIPVSSVTWGSSITTAPVESQELSVDIPCVYPTTSIQINFTVKTAGEADEVLQLSSNDIQTTGNAGCVCDAGSVSASYSISYPDKTVQVHVSVLHTLLTKKGFTTLDSQGNITFRGPTRQTNTVFLTERMTTTTSYINEYNNTTLPMASKIATASNFISNTETSNSFGEISTSFFDAEISNSTFMSLNSENSLKYINSSEMIDITISHVSSIVFKSPGIRTETTKSFADSTTALLMSNLLLSSFDSLAYFYVFSSQTDSFYSRTFFEISFPGTNDIKSNTLTSIPGVWSETTTTITKRPTVLLTGISDSVVKFNSTPFRTIADKSFTNELIGSTFGKTESTYVQTSYLTTTHLITSYTSNIGIISETEIIYTKSYFGRTDMLLTIYQHVVSETRSNVSSELISQKLRTNQPIISIDTLVYTTDAVDADTTTKISSGVLQTYIPDSTTSVSNKEPFLSEASHYLSTISLSNIRFKTSFFESSRYTSYIEDDIITTEVQNSGFLTSISINLSQSNDTSISINTNNSVMQTSIYASKSTTTDSRMFMSDYLHSSFYPTELDFSSRTTEYLVTSMQSTKSILVSEENQSIVSSNIRTTNNTVYETQSNVYTVQNTEIHTIKHRSLIIRTYVEQSDMRTLLDTSNSEFEHQRESSMANHSYSGTIAVNSLITSQSTFRNSFYSELYSSDSSNVILSTSVLLSTDTLSTAFISTTTIQPTSNTKAKLSETTKNVIFITILSVVVVIIISVSSIMLLTSFVLTKRNTTLERKTDSVSKSNDTQSVRKVFPEFPHKESSIYPRFSNSLSSNMTSPYIQNWNKV